MSRNNGASFNESITIARDRVFPYRSGMGMMQSAEWVQYMEDFTAMITSNVPTGWQAAVIDAAATLTNLTSTNENGGIARVTGSAASEGVAIHRPRTVTLGTGTAASTGGRKFFMEARVRTQLAAQAEIQFGLSVLTAVVNPEDLYNTTADSFITFGIVDGSAVPVLQYDKANAGPQTDTVAALYGATLASQLAAATLANNTFVTLGMTYNGSAAGATGGAITCYVNGTPVIISTVAAKIPDNVVLAPFIAARKGAAGASLTDFDYVRYAIQRTGLDR